MWPGTLAKTILDPLSAQLIYLKDPKGIGMVVVSLDLVAIPHDLSDQIRTGIVQELGVDYNLVVLNCSHTHSGPYMTRELTAGVGATPQIETEYFASLTDKVIKAARIAGKSMKTVNVEVFESTSKIGINRRGKDKSGVRGIIPDPNGPIADKLWVLKLSPLDRSPSAVIFSYACHPVLVYGYNLTAVSADFPGVARNAIRSKLGPGVHAQFIQGFAGDVRPRIVADLEHHKFRTPTPADLHQCGEQLAQDVVSALVCKGTVLNLDIAGTMDHPFLPRGNPPPRSLYEKMAADNSSQFRRDAAHYWLARYDSGEGFARGTVCALGLIRLADNQWICTFSGEPCAEWSPKILQWLSPRNVVMWGYSQEVISYIPTEEMLPEGGYEVLNSNYGRASSPAPFGPGINEAVHASLLRQAAFISAPVK